MNGYQNGDWETIYNPINKIKKAKINLVYQPKDATYLKNSFKISLLSEVPISSNTSGL